MAQETTKDNAIQIKCICGKELLIDPELLGRIFPCPHCGSYLRTGLQFLMVDEALAPNIAAMCTCGRFIVEPPDRAGKTVKCKVCGRRVVLPKPAKGRTKQRVLRIPPRILEKQLSRVLKKGKRQEEGGTGGQVERLRRAGHSGRISLRPGQKVCVNEDCSIPLPPGANVCPRCGVNATTGEKYEGPGPEADPVGKWKEM
ncbi:MAG: hypothetical protein ACLFWL_05595 [Candidatus Brocadiia bacterium]